MITAKVQASQVSALQGAEFTVLEKREEIIEESAPPPYTTASMMQDAIHYPSGHRCLHQGQIEITRMLQRILHSLLRDLPEKNTMQLLTFQLRLEDMIEMPGHRLAFPIRIRGQIDSFRFADLRPQLLNDVLP